MPFVCADVSCIVCGVCGCHPWCYCYLGVVTVIDVFIGIVILLLRVMLILGFYDLY